MSTARAASAPRRPPRRSREDVLAGALHILQHGGLTELSMRNIAAHLGLQPSALYWHFPNKQSLLAALSDSVLDRAVLPHRQPAQPGASSADWRQQAIAEVLALREALLSVPDGAELVASTNALGLGSDRARTALLRALDPAALPDSQAQALSRVLLHYLLGHTSYWQQRRQAEQLGIREVDPADERAELEEGLRLILE